MIAGRNLNHIKSLTTNVHQVSMLLPLLPTMKTLWMLTQRRKREHRKRIMVISLMTIRNHPLKRNPSSSMKSLKSIMMSRLTTMNSLMNDTYLIIRRISQPKSNKKMFMFTILVRFRKDLVTNNVNNFYRTGSTVSTHHQHWFSALLFSPNGVICIWTVNEFLIERLSIRKGYVLINGVSKFTIFGIITRHLFPFLVTFTTTKKTRTDMALFREVPVRRGIDEAQDAWGYLITTHQWFHTPSSLHYGSTFCRDKNEA